jgi:hypothetical protein
MGYSLQVSLNLGFTQFSTQGVSQSNVKPQLLKCVVLGLTAAGAPLVVLSSKLAPSTTYLGLAHTMIQLYKGVTVLQG